MMYCNGLLMLCVSYRFDVIDILYSDAVRGFGGDDNW